MLEISNQSYNHTGSCEIQTFNNQVFIFLHPPGSCEENEGLGTGYNPM